VLTIVRDKPFNINNVNINNNKAGGWFYDLIHADSDHVNTDSHTKPAEFGSDSAFRLVPSAFTLVIYCYYSPRKPMPTLTSRREWKVQST